MLRKTKKCFLSRLSQRKKRAAKKVRCVSFNNYKAKGTSIVKLRIKLIFIIALLISLLIYCDVQMKPVVLHNAEERADACISNVVYDSALALLQSEQYADKKFVNVLYDNDGTVNSVQCDSVLLNKFMADVNNGIEAKILQDSSGSISLHMGTLFKLLPFMGKGPLLTYKYDLSTNVNCELISSFSSAGINQTDHSITLRVSVNTTVMIPWCSSNRDVVSDFPIAQTVIVGNVPNSYSQIDLSGGTLYDKSDSDDNLKNDEK